MPRKLTRRLRSHPVTFSRFSRTLALASLYKVNRNIRNSKNSRHAPPVSSDKGGVDLAMKNKNTQPESSDDEEFEGSVQAEFAFFDPKPDDFHGVKVLLQNYLDDKQWDASGLTDLILAQTTVGTVVKIEEDEDNGVYAVATVLNLGRYKDHKCIMDIKEFLLEVCQENSIQQNIKSMLGEKAQDVGLLISQRVVNLPTQLLPPLYDALFDEVSWATEDEPTKELRSSFCFKYYLFVSKIYEHKKIKNKHDGTISTSEEAIIYTKPEEEILHELCSWSFKFPLRTQQHTAHELKNYRIVGLVMAVEATKVSTFREQLRSLIDE
ncbi:protein BCCIP homolog isoform X1 [Apium graveolens]|uniref:protein BCCIP homolog isoform X1 n=2 Tax=Apium graveolens TaxID=4045 RepID=UPI003D79667D